jgi:Holliday junction resolvase RusA-like endonuclease
MEHLITIRGRIPSLKNSKQILRLGNRAILAPSKAYKEWHTEQMLLLRNEPRFATPVEITAFMYFPDNRGADLDNKIGSVLELLVDRGIIHDDKWQIVRKITVTAMGVDKVSPRCEIIIDTRGYE